MISAKGGVGKTTTTINLCSALIYFGRKVIALDANFANPDMGLHLGLANAKKTLHSALKGEQKLADCLYRLPTGVYVIPGSIAYDEARNVRKENLIDVIHSLVDEPECVIIDSTPGLGHDAQVVISACDYVIIVTTPDICAVTGSLKMLKLCEELETKVLGVIINKVRREDYEMTSSNIGEFLHLPVLGEIPEDKNIRKSLYTRRPLLWHDLNCDASNSFKSLACQLLGKKYVEHIEKEQETSVFGHLLKNLGFR